MCLCSELRPHFSLASESDPADQEDVYDDDLEKSSTHQSRAPPSATHDDTVATSGVSTLSSTVSHESHNAQRSVSMELGRMKLETNRLVFIVIRHVNQSVICRNIAHQSLLILNTCVSSYLSDSRLLEQLLEKEREYQAILQQVLEEREQEIRLLRLRSQPAGLSFNLIYLSTKLLLP